MQYPIVKYDPSPEETKKAELKEKYIQYFRKLPLQRWAAAHIGRNEDTILRWRKEDAEFAERVRVAKADYLLENVNKIKDKAWLIERIFRDDFSPPKQTLEIDVQAEITKVMHLIHDAVYGKLPADSSGSDSSKNLLQEPKG